MKQIRVLLVDDERIGRHRLRQLLERESDIEVIDECCNGWEALQILQTQPADVLFLDVNMPGMGGFELLGRLEDQDPEPLVVFVTAYDDHAVRAFEACALDYLLKPFSPERLAKTLSRVRSRMKLRKPESEVAGRMADSVTSSGSQRFVVRNGGRVAFIETEEIDWVEAAGNYAILHVGGKNHMIRGTMSALEAQLPSERFMRMSRSAIVNLTRIQSLETSSNGGDFAVLWDGQRVPITRSIREISERVGAA